MAAAAAWTGSRDGRRASELVAATSRPRWVTQLATWLATACWAMLAYLGCVAVLYGVTAGQAAWGGPVWWPAAACALGFAAGVVFPTQFTAPLTAVVMFFVLFAALHPGVSSTYALLSPANSSIGLNLPEDVGVFYPYLPDVAIAQVMFLGGLAIAALGVLGLPAAAGAPRLRGAAAVVAAAGLVAAITGVTLAGTARLTADGEVIPALHDAVSDRPLPYTPVCADSAVPVCLHPAFRAYLPDVTAALGPVLREVASLPGAPVGVTQVAANDLDQTTGGETITGSPQLLRLPLGSYLPPPLPLVEWLQSKAAPAVVGNVIGGGASSAGPAQQAVEAGLLEAAGIPLLAPRTSPHGGGALADGVRGPAPRSPAYAAAQRFAALPATARQAWLVTHLAELRAGQITLAELP